MRVPPQARDWQTIPIWFVGEVLNSGAITSVFVRTWLCEDCDSSSDLVASQVGITSSFANFPPLGIRVCTDRIELSGFLAFSQSDWPWCSSLSCCSSSSTCGLFWISPRLSSVALVSKCPGVGEVFWNHTIPLSQVLDCKSYWIVSDDLLFHVLDFKL